LRPRWAPAPAGHRSRSRSFNLRTDICPAIKAEIEANNQKVKVLASEQGLKVGQNVAAGVAGLVVWPLLFAMDFQDSASKEVTALQSRQQYLASLAEQRCAPAAPPQAAPVRKR
jgi:hypothetical protein